MTDETTNETRSKYTPHNLNGGRPKLFGDVQASKRSVLLPDSAWEYLLTINDSISIALDQIINEHQAIEK